MATTVVTSAPGVTPVSTASIDDTVYGQVKASILRLQDGDRIEAQAIQDAADNASRALDRKPKITAQPTDLVKVAPATATFVLTASGTPTPEIQWYVRSGDGPYFALAGKTAASCALGATSVGMDGNIYKAVVKNYKGTVETVEVTLTVTAS